MADILAKVEEPVEAQPQIQKPNEGQQAGPVATKTNELTDSLKVDTPQPPQMSQITDDEIKADISERKDRFQKRIDKITAEKYQALDEVKKMRQELEALRTKVEKPKEEKTQYSMEQLEEAFEHGYQEGNPKLMKEAIKEMIKLERKSAFDDINKSTEAEKQAVQKKSQIWNNFIQNHASDDPDLDFNNQSSPVYRYTLYYLQNHPEYYNAFGEYSELQAANDALRAVTELKQKKKLGLQLKSTEKDLMQEKLKTQIPVGNASFDSSVQSKSEPTQILVDKNVDDNLASYLKMRDDAKKRFIGGGLLGQK